jgi:hypothetical protein
LYPGIDGYSEPLPSRQESIPRHCLCHSSYFHHGMGPASPRATDHGGASPMLLHAPHIPSSGRDFGEHGSTTPNSSSASATHGAQYASEPRPTFASSSTGIAARLPSLRAHEGPPPAATNSRVRGRGSMTALLFLSQPRQYEMERATGAVGLISSRRDSDNDGHTTRVSSSARSSSSQRRDWIMNEQ